jgi:hypothetical protein
VRSTLRGRALDGAVRPGRAGQAPSAIAISAAAYGKIAQRVMRRDTPRRLLACEAAEHRGDIGRSGPEHRRGDRSGTYRRTTRTLRSVSFDRLPAASAAVIRRR